MTRRDLPERRSPFLTIVDQRGAALPLAVLTLGIVLSLATALAAVGSSEPTIAGNHERSTRARAAAEAGLQAALAALSIPEAGTAQWSTPLAAAPFVVIPGAGAGYRVAVEARTGGTLAERANERVVTVTGYAPSDTAPHRAVASLQAVLQRDSIMATYTAAGAIVMPAGGSLRGEVDARASAGWCRSGPPLAGAVAGPSGAIAASGSVWGPGNATPNEPGADILDRGTSGVTLPARAPAFTADELAALRALATERGTFYAGHPAPVRFGGEAGPLPDGLIFVEGDVEVEVDETAWGGWLIAVPGGTRTGTVTFGCRHPCAQGRRHLTMTGLIHAADGVSLDTPGDDRALTVRGVIVAAQGSATPSTISPRDTADFRVLFDCGAVRSAVTGTPTTTGVGLVRHGWYLKLGTYKEVSRQ